MFNDYEDQAQEEMDYAAGCFGNEFQAAYALSRRERESDDRAKIAALVAAGRFVVYYSTEDFCRFTDASLGERRSYVADFATREEAEREVTCEDMMVAGPVVADTLPAPAMDDDLPF